MEWIYLLIATIFEIGWPSGFKMAVSGEHKILWFIFAFTSMALSGIFLYMAQKHIPVGTAYAIWTGIGAVSTFLIGVYVFHDVLNVTRILGILFIISGILLLKF